MDVQLQRRDVLLQFEQLDAQVLVLLLDQVEHVGLRVRDALVQQLAQRLEVLADAVLRLVQFLLVRVQKV